MLHLKKRKMSLLFFFNKKYARCLDSMECDNVVLFVSVEKNIIFLFVKIILLLLEDKLIAEHMKIYLFSYKKIILSYNLSRINSE